MMPDPADAVVLLRALQWAASAGDGAPCCPLCRARASQGHHAADCTLAAVLADAAPPRWRHRRRGTTYREIGHATLQHSGGTLGDQDRMVVYRAEADGALGVRALIEFSDGRFERLA